MIDPLEAVIAYLATDSDLNTLTNGQIAPRHLYGARDGWTTDSQALQVRYDGGFHELYLSIQVVRLEFRCYGPTLYAASQVWRALVDITRDYERQTIPTTEGDALMHYLNLTSAPSVFEEPDIEIEALLCFAEASVAEAAIT